MNGRALDWETVVIGVALMLVSVALGGVLVLLMLSHGKG